MSAVKAELKQEASDAEPDTVAAAADNDADDAEASDEVEEVVEKPGERELCARERESSVCDRDVERPLLNSGLADQRYAQNSLHGVKCIWPRCSVKAAKKQKTEKKVKAKAKDDAGELFSIGGTRKVRGTSAKLLLLCSASCRNH